jgi:uncharacterized protein
VVSPQHLLAAVLFIGFPVWDVYETRRLKASTDPRRKILTYQRILAVEWAFALIVLTILRSQIFFLWPSAHQAVLQQKIGVSFVWGFVGAATLALPAQIFLTHRNIKLREKTLEAFKRLAFLLPVTRDERVWFVIVSLTAGICEEILYRGFLIRYLADNPWHLGVWMALGTSSVVFGLAHSYQGVAGIVGTAAIGAALAVMFVVSGSLWLPMVIHALVDLRVLLLLRPEDLLALQASGTAI